ISMARPPSTYEGRTSTGYPMRRATSTACSTDRAVPFAGWVTPSRRASASNRSRSSATSIESGDVPRIGTPAASSGLGSRSGVGPAPQDDDAPLAERLGLGLGVVGAVEVGRGGRELTGARVHRLVDRVDAELPAPPTHRLLRASAQLAELAI